MYLFHLLILYAVYPVQEAWSLSQGTRDTRRGTPWRGCQSILENTTISLSCMSLESGSNQRKPTKHKGGHGIEPLTHEVQATLLATQGHFANTQGHYIIKSVIEHKMKTACSLNPEDLMI